MESLGQNAVQASYGLARLSEQEKNKVLLHVADALVAQSKMILQVHDELIFDALISEEEQLKKIIKEVMENTFKLKVPLKVDIETGSDWYQAK